MKLSILLQTLVIGLAVSAHVYGQPGSSLFREMYSHTTPKALLGQVSFGPEGVPRLAVSMHRELAFGGPQTYVFDFPSMNPIDSFPAMAGFPVFTRDGRNLAMLVRAGALEDVRVWEYGQSSSPVRQLRLGQNPSVFAMTASLDSRYLYIGCGYGVRISDLEQDTLQVLDTLRHWRAYDTIIYNGAALDVALSHAGDRLVSVDVFEEAVNGVKMWNALSHELLWELSPDTLGVGWVRWSPDDSRLLTIARAPLEDVSRVEERSASDGRVLRFLELPSSRFPYGAWYLMDGEYIAVLCRDSTIRVWRAETLELVDELHTPLPAVDVSPDGRFVAAARSDGVLQIFEFIPSSVSEPVAGESGVQLLAPRPNPAREVVEIPFRLARSEEVELTLVDIRGRAIRTLTTRYFESGFHIERMETDDLSSGVYYLVLRSGGERHARSVRIIR